MEETALLVCWKKCWISWKNFSSASPKTYCVLYFYLMWGGFCCCCFFLNFVSKDSFWHNCASIFLENMDFWQNFPFSSTERSVYTTKDKVSAASEWGQLSRTECPFCLESSEPQRALAPCCFPRRIWGCWLGCLIFWLSCKFPNKSRTRLCKLVESLLTGLYFFGACNTVTCWSHNR